MITEVTFHITYLSIIIESFAGIIEIEKTSESIKSNCKY